MPRGLFKTLCFLSLTSVVFNAFCFYKFAMVYFGYSNKEKFLYDFLGLVPFLIAFIMLIISLFNGFIFDVSDEVKIIKGSLYPLLFVSAFIYFAIIVISSLIETIRTNSTRSKKNFLLIFVLVIFLVTWVIIDNLLESLTIIPIAIFSVIFILFTNFQQESINTDALTKLNNRRKTDEYLSSQLPTVSKENPLHLFMCDINSFKAINDNYGHLEGDDALIILSNVINSCLHCMLCLASITYSLSFEVKLLLASLEAFGFFV